VAGLGQEGTSGVEVRALIHVVERLGLADEARRDHRVQRLDLAAVDHVDDLVPIDGGSNGLADVDVVHRLDGVVEDQVPDRTAVDGADRKTLSTLELTDELGTEDSPGDVD